MTGQINVNKISARSGTTVNLVSGQTFKANTIAGTTTAGSITVQGEGSATTNLQQGLTKAWCFFDGTAGTIAVADSYNVGSLTDSSAGEYGVNFTNNMSNANYSRYATAGATNASSVGGESSAHATSTSSCRIKAVKPTIAVADDSKVSCGINGDLA